MKQQGSFLMCLSGVGGIREECEEETERMMPNLLENWILYMPEDRLSPKGLWQHTNTKGMVRSGQHRLRISIQHPLMGTFNVKKI
jgi:hypothetical protein